MCFPLVLYRVRKTAKTLRGEKSRGEVLPPSYLATVTMVRAFSRLSLPYKGAQVTKPIALSLSYSQGVFI